MYRIIVSSEARKSLKNIDKRFAKKIVKAIEDLRQYPYLGKPLLGALTGLFSLRVWPYRIIYRVYKDKLIILILAIKHRQGAYK